MTAMLNTEVTTQLMDRQTEIEMRMQSLGVEQFWKQIEKAKQDRQESKTGYGVSLLNHNLTKVAAAVAAFVAEAKSGKAGRRHLAVKYLEQVDPKVAALLALREMINGVSTKRLLQRVAGGQLYVERFESNTPLPLSREVCKGETLWYYGKWRVIWTPPSTLTHEVGHDQEPTTEWLAQVLGRTEEAGRSDAYAEGGDLCAGFYARRLHHEAAE